MNLDRGILQTARDGGELRRILLVRLGALGDIVLTVPAQQFLARSFPEAEIEWLTSPPYVPLLSSVPGIGRVHAVDTRKWRRGRREPLSPLHCLAVLRRTGFDLAIDFQGLIKSALLARLSGAARIRGFCRNQARESLASVFYSDRVCIAEGERHQFARHIDLLAPPRWQGELTPRFPLLPPENDTRWIEQELGRLGIDRPVLLNPGGGWATKRWEPVRFARLAERIEQELGLPTLFTFGPGEADLAESIRRHLRAIPFRSFPTSILQLAVLAQRSRLMVAGDTGPLHLAVAMGAPCVAILGPAQAWRTGPAGPGDEVVMHSRACPHPYRRQCRDHFCMDIPVEPVFEAVRRRLGV